MMAVVVAVAADAAVAVVANTVILGAEPPFDKMLASRADLGPKHLYFDVEMRANVRRNGLKRRESRSGRSKLGREYRLRCGDGRD